MPMKVDKRLNLVKEIEDDGKSVYVHSTPIGQEIFKRYTRIIARTCREAYATAGVLAPRVAANLLEEIAIETGQWEDRKNIATGEVVGPGVKNGLMAEIKRLTSVICWSGSGWEPLPFDVAVQQGKLDADTAAEVENLIVFFTLASWMNEKRDLPNIYENVFGAWKALATSSTSTEWARSLPTSTETVSSGKKAESSVPS